MMPLPDSPENTSKNLVNLLMKAKTEEEIRNELGEDLCFIIEHTIKFIQTLYIEGFEMIDIVKGMESAIEEIPYKYFKNDCAASPDSPHSK